MKIFIIIILLSIISSGLYAQNLLSNGSFEQTQGCPAWYGYLGSALDSVIDWYSPLRGGTQGTIHNNICGLTPPNTGYLPKNNNGWQNPRSGDSYITMTMVWCRNLFIYSYDSIFTSKSFSAVHFSDSMIQNTTYNIRLYMSLAEIPWGRTHTQNGLKPVAIDSLGFYFSNTKDTIYNGTYNTPISIKPFNPQVYDTSGYYTDTCQWIEVSTQYTASGGEQYMAFGDFKLYSDSIVNYASVDSTVLGLIWSYRAIYYIDDVAIWRADTTPPVANAGMDTTICRGGKIRLGSNNYNDYVYEWWPELGLSGDSTGFVWASPDTTTTYFLQATDDIFTKTMDSVTVFVNNCGQNDTTVCVEQQFVMGSANNPLWNYQWSPSTWLSSDTVGMPLCNPMANQNYQLLITNTAGDTIALDSTNLIVGSCYFAEAGTDSLICKGDSLQIGTQQFSFIDYAWSPNFMISDTTIGNPIVWPDTLKWYFLQLTDTMGNNSYDSVLVDVQVCIGILPSAPLSQRVKVYPNPAKEQITFELLDYSKRNNELNIYNSTGMIVYNGKFDGTRKMLNTSKFQSGIYFYRIIDSEKHRAVGKFIVW